MVLSTGGFLHYLPLLLNVLVPAKTDRRNTKSVSHYSQQAQLCKMSYDITALSILNLLNTSKLFMHNFINWRRVLRNNLDIPRILKVYRGYYTVTRRYELYFLMVRKISRAKVQCSFYYIDILRMAFLTIFGRFPTTFWRLPKIFQKLCRRADKVSRKLISVTSSISSLVKIQVTPLESRM